MYAQFHLVPIGLLLLKLHQCFWHLSITRVSALCLLAYLMVSLPSTTLQNFTWKLEVCPLVRRPAEGVAIVDEVTAAGYN